MCELLLLLLLLEARVMTLSIVVHREKLLNLFTLTLLLSLSHTLHLPVHFSQCSISR